jgi:tRNA threonylcarbamoyladenosine biosynthesis protein TsaB
MVQRARARGFVDNNEIPLMLSLETATRAGSVAISRGQSILVSAAGDPEISHSNDLLCLIRTALEDAKVSLREIEVFAASVGPGSFTGLRIGLATLKSFAATLERPCVGVPTLEAIVHSTGLTGNTLAMLPAGRGEVFAQLFSVDGEGNVEALDGPTHLAPHKLLDQLDSLPAILTIAGEGAQQHAELIRERALAEGIEYIENLKVEKLKAKLDAVAQGKRVWLLTRSSCVLAESVARSALKRYRAGQSCRPETLRAIYVRPSDAELKEI